MGGSRIPDAVREMAGTILAALEAAGIGLTINSAGEDGSITRVYANDAVSTILGQEPGPANAVNPLSHLRPDERVRIAELRQRLREGEPLPALLHTIVVRPDGTEVPIEVGMSRTEWRGAQTTVAFVRDITSYREIENQLRASESRFRTLAESAPDSITVAVEGKLVWANLASARALGADSVDQLLGMRLSDLVREDQVPIMMERLARTAAGEHQEPFVYHSRRLDGSPLLMEISSSIIEWEGKPAVLGYGRDVTERQRIETELMQADRLATVGTLAAGVAHEINNPLTYVLLHLQRLLQLVPQLAAHEDQRREIAGLVEEAIEGSERVRGIVRELLAFSREGGNQRRPLHLVPVLEAAIKITGTAHGNRVAIESDIPTEVPLVAADEARLGQVFLNLLVNAVQAFGSPPPANAVVQVAVYGDQGCTVIEIRDNGPGIDDAALKRAFDPFFTTKPVGSGTGLGLPISRSIVESFGGSLQLDNHAEGGACATITLPGFESGNHGGPHDAAD